MRRPRNCGRVLIIQLADDGKACAVAVADMQAGGLLRRVGVAAGEGVHHCLMLAFRFFRPIGQCVGRAAQQREMDTQVIKHFIKIRIMSGSINLTMKQAVMIVQRFTVGHRFFSVDHPLQERDFFIGRGGHRQLYSDFFQPFTDGKKLTQTIVADIRDNQPAFGARFRQAERFQPV